MAEKTTSFGTSGWSAEELARLDAMVAADKTDRSKFLRALCGKEWEARERQKRILEEITRAEMDPKRKAVKA